MLLKSIQYCAWVLSSVLLFATALQLGRGGHRASFRVFFWYLVIVGTHGLFNLMLSFVDPVWWFYSFFMGIFLTTLLGFAVLFEVAKSAVTIPSIRLDRSTFFTLCAAAAVLAVLVCATTEVNGNAFMRARIVFEAALRVMQISILAIFAAISIFFGLLWRRIEFGIVLGYGIYAASQLSVMYLHATGGPATQTLFEFVPTVSFCFSALIWLVYSRLTDPSLEVEVEPLLSQINSSSAALERLQ